MKHRLDFIKALSALIRGQKLDIQDHRIAPWAELATSENNTWMKAIRLHESGNYENACFQYMLDAKNSWKEYHFGRAALSFKLAADCLESIGQRSLAGQISKLARRCDEHQVPTSADSEIAFPLMSESSSREQRQRQPLR